MQLLTPPQLRLMSVPLATSNQCLPRIIQAPSSRQNSRRTHPTFHYSPHNARKQRIPHRRRHPRNLANQHQRLITPPRQAVPRLIPTLLRHPLGPQPLRKDRQGSGRSSRSLADPFLHPTKRDSSASHPVVRVYLLRPVPPRMRQASAKSVLANLEQPVHEIIKRGKNCHVIRSKRMDDMMASHVQVTAGV